MVVGLQPKPNTRRLYCSSDSTRSRKMIWQVITVLLLLLVPLGHAIVAPPFLLRELLFYTTPDCSGPNERSVFAHALDECQPIFGGASLTHNGAFVGNFTYLAVTCTSLIAGNLLPAHVAGTCGNATYHTTTNFRDYCFSLGGSSAGKSFTVSCEARPSNCFPNDKLSKKQCAMRIKSCNPAGVPMKW